MRATTFLVYIFFLLFGGNNFASTIVAKNLVKPTSFQNFSDDKQASVSIDNQNTIEFDDVDFDLEEDFSADNSFKDLTSFCATQNTFVSTYFTTNFDFTLSNFYAKSFKTFPHLNGNSCPIYIVQRVLRI